MPAPRRFRINFQRLNQILRNRCIVCGRIIPNGTSICRVCSRRMRRGTL